MRHTREDQGPRPDELERAVERSASSTRGSPGSRATTGSAGPFHQWQRSNWPRRQFGGRPGNRAVTSRHDVAPPSPAATSSCILARMADHPSPVHSWPSPLRVGSLRIVRSSAHYEAAVDFYRDLVGLPVIDEFRDSYGEDGAIFGPPTWPTHPEGVRSQPERG